MAIVKPFRALRYTDKAGDLAYNVCPPYDIISPAERERYIETSKNNIIRLELPVGEDAYRRAGELYKAMCRGGILACDQKPGYYIYEQQFTVNGETKTIKTVFARVKLCEFSENVVLPHEETLSKAKADRFNLMSETYCNFSPIYSMYTDADRVITDKIESLSAGKAPIEFTAPDGNVQRLWKIEEGADTAFIEKAFADKKLYIADGHHRYETALNFRRKMREDGIITSDDHPGNYCMMVLVPMESEGLVVFPTHRLVKGLKAFDEAALFDKLTAYFEISDIKADAIDVSLASHTDGKAYVYCSHNGTFKLLVLKDTPETRAEISRMTPGHSDAYRDLDVTVLHTLILEKVFGIDKENMANQINLSYTRDKEEAIACAAEEGFNCAFLLNATKVSDIRDVALAGDKMPQKSTYFYPKLITGLVMNDLLAQ